MGRTKATADPSTAPRAHRYAVVQARTRAAPLRMTTQRETKVSEKTGLELKDRLDFAVNRDVRLGEAVDLEAFA